MGEDPPRYGNAHPSIVPYGVFDAEDGPLVITVGNNSQFALLHDVIERPDLAADERFKTNILRSANREVLMPGSTASSASAARRCSNSSRVQAFPAAKCSACSNPCSRSAPPMPGS